MKIKLIYFDMPFWRAEVARLPLFMSNIDFEDLKNKKNQLRNIHTKLLDKNINIENIIFEEGISFKNNKKQKNIILNLRASKAKIR